MQILYWKKLPGKAIIINFNLVNLNKFRFTMIFAWKRLMNVLMEPLVYRMAVILVVNVLHFLQEVDVRPESIRA